MDPVRLATGSMAVFAFLLLGILVPSLEAEKRRCTLDDYRAGAPKSGFICGAQIPRMLSLVCNGIYNNRSPGKRDVGSHPQAFHRASALNTVDHPSLYDLDPQDMEDAEDDGSKWDSDIFLPRASAFSYLRHKRSTGDHYRTGVYCECCVHRCTFNELQSYCSGAQRDKRSAKNMDSTRWLTQLSGNSIADAEHHNDIS